MTSPPLLELRAVERHFKTDAGVVKVLRGVDLDIYSGEFLAIVGQSGSGKSTLMHILGCLDHSDSGSYRIAGRTIQGLDANGLAALRRSTFGFVFQRYHLLDHFNALENVEMPASYLGLSVEQRQVRARLLLARLGLAERETFKPAALSGGQQQRVSIARALMNGGNVILADEPTGALDRQSGMSVMQTLRDLHAMGHTIILVTHDRELAMMTDRVVEIQDGVICSDTQLKVAQRVACEAQPRVEPAPESRWSGLQRFLSEGLATAWLSLVRHRLRTMLTLWSVSMGIACVVLMVAVGGGAQEKILAEVRSWGADSIYILPGKSMGDVQAAATPDFTNGDIEALERLPEIDNVSPNVQHSAMAQRGNQTTTVTVRGVNEHYFSIRNRRFVLGSGFKQVHMRDTSPVVVIGAAARDKFFSPHESPIGKTLYIGVVPSTVIGVLEAGESDAEEPGSTTFFMPVSTVTVRFQGLTRIDYLMAKQREGYTNHAAEAAITALLTARRGTRDFNLLTFDKQIQAMKRNSRMMSVVMLSTALICLTVAGIGVMNIMLVSVSERTPEIGIRMAVGGRPEDIKRQFLTEALMVCGLGGVLGSVLSFGLQSVLPFLLPTLQLRFSLASLLLACGSSILIGIIFGYLPARNASRLNPIRALQHD